MSIKFKTIPLFLQPMEYKINLLDQVDLDNYQYYLPEDKIAHYPLKTRSDSKLLVFKNQEIAHHRFSDIPALIPENSLLVFNNTKVIQARLHFSKTSGATIEVFVLNPASGNVPINEVMNSSSTTIWRCMIGNKKKWKSNEKLVKTITISGVELDIEVEWVDREKDVVKFNWKSDSITFSEVLTASGNVPLPPYIKRMPENEDTIRYQTVYSNKEGAVAAPTAGLHFTNEILDEIRQKKSFIDYLTLHVSAGTFQPIKHKNILQHPMHKEQVLININNIDNLCKAKKVVAVGTTSLRSLESLYWFGVKILLHKEYEFFVDKLMPYKHRDDGLPNQKEAFNAVKDWMVESGKKEILGETEIFIFPGYHFQVCSGLVTNFHMPGSTLILLVAAFVGNSWKKIYEEALEHGYRFLSYGDSSFLIR